METTLFSIQISVWHRNCLRNISLVVTSTNQQADYIDPDCSPDNVNLTNAIRPQNILDIRITGTQSIEYAHFEFSGKDYLVTLSQAAK